MLVVYVFGEKVVPPGGRMELGQLIPWCPGGSISSVVWLPGWQGVLVFPYSWRTTMSGDPMPGDPTYDTVMWLASASGMFQDRWAQSTLCGWPPPVIWEVMQVQLGALGSGRPCSWEFDTERSHRRG